MGGISSRLARQYYRFNAENRAHKILKSNQPRPAPKHEKTKLQIEMLEKEMPALKEELSKFDPKLHDRLKQVYVTTDVTPVQNAFIKPPPLSHKVRRTSDFGFDENEPAAIGRISLRHVIQLIMVYSQSDDSTIKELAKNYKLKEKDAENILKYYQCFNLHLPRGKFETAKYMNTILFGNESGEILFSDQFIKRLEESKGVREGITKGIPPLSKEVKALEEEEERQKRELPSGTSRKPDQVKQIKSSEKED